MIFRSIEEYDNSGFSPKVAIIGSGPAGITIARRLAKAKVPCVLLNAGSDEYSQESQDVYQGKVFGDHYFDLDVARLRYLGGTSNHWVGWCRLLDAHDFEQRDWIPNSGWPIKRDAIEPYLDSTREILGLRNMDDDVVLSNDINWSDLIRSDPVRFGEKYGDELAASELIAVVFNTYVTDLVAQNNQIAAANILSNRSTKAQVIAPKYVVATGGIENSRLLLWSNERSQEPVVPEPKALGRYWMEHPEYTVGDAIVYNSGAYKRAEEDGWAFFSPSTAGMKDAEVMNFRAVIIPQSLPWSKRLLTDFACTAPTTAHWLFKQIDKDITCLGNRVDLSWEQAPVFDNHVALSTSDKDFAGIPRPELHWKKGELERKTLVEGLRMLGRTLAEKDIGRLKMDDWVRNGDEYPIEDQEIAGYHHMGGTRMSSDPRKGVVDGNCKVHGMENLYVGGSSIFTTSGYANPTMTIVAFAERLGEHLAINV